MGVCVCVRGVTDRPKKIIISVCNICDVPTASRHLLFCFVVFSSFFLKFFPSISSLSLSLSLSHLFYFRVLPPRCILVPELGVAVVFN